MQAVQPPEPILQKNAAIWVHDEKEAWTEARVVQLEKTTKGFQLVFHRDGEPQNTHTVVISELPPRRNTTLNETRLDNLTDLTHLNEPSVLATIRERYLEDDIYTYSVSVNPYRKLDLYTNELIWTFPGRSREELEPHLFAVAEEAYRSLLNDGKSQSIIVSGESGAGKTISAKYIMRYLAEVCKQGSDIGGIESRILATNPILEAFGNAKTVRNDNSSRFGKYVQILFSSQNQIIGAQIKTFLLEKTRVGSHAVGERNYHIFYQMLAGLSGPDLKALQLTNDPAQYAFLGSEHVDGVDDKEEFELTRKSLTLAGFSDVDQWALWSVLAAILHLGNIQIVQDDDLARIHEADPALLHASQLLGVDPVQFRKWLSIRLLRAGTETVETPLSSSQSQACRDSVARHLYGLVFDHIVGMLNRALKPEKLIQSMKFIGVLDIYGFEKFEKNSFEQFCINYANEKLQFQFNQQVFKLEQALYEAEGIQWSFINFNDNQPCIDMIEGKHGILKMISEECRVPNGSDKQLAEKINMKFDESLLCRQKFNKESQFTVKHFAYNVPYEIEGFLEKNRDSFPLEQLELLRSSSNTFIAPLFDDNEENAVASASKSGSHDAMSRETGKNTGLAFKASLSELLDVMGDTRMHYIRCIKPNQTKEPLLFDSPFVVQQLRACGIIETIRISSAGFPGRWSFADFCSRYRVLVPEEHPDGTPEAASKILGKIDVLDGSEYQIGKTRIFLRAGVLGKLEDRRTQKIVSSAVSIQSGVRAFLQRAIFRKTMDAVSTLQKCSRLFNAKEQYSNLQKNHAATKLSSSFRRFACITEVVESKKAAQLIRSAVRRYGSRLKWFEHQAGQSAISIESSFRGWLQRRSQQSTRSAALSITLGCRRLLARKELKMLRSESKSVAKLMENSGELERKVMDLAGKLHAMELLHEEETAKSQSLFEGKVALESELKEKGDEIAYLEDQVLLLQEELEKIKQEKDKRILELERELEETQDKLERLEKGSTMDIMKRSDSGKMREPVGSHHHLRKLSMDSKLEHIAEFSLPTLPTSIQQEAQVPRKELAQMLKDPRVMEELQSMVNLSAGFDVRRLDEESSPILLRLPSLLLEHWIATWLDLDPEPLLLGDNFYIIMTSIRNLCARAVNSNEGPLTADQKYAYWLANLVQLLGFLQHRITALSMVPGGTLVVSKEQQMSAALVVLLQMRTVAARTVEDLYRQWLAELCRWFAKLGPAALMDHQGLQGYSSSAAERQAGSRFLNSILGRRASNPQLSTEVLLDALDELAQAMSVAQLQSEIVEQMLSSLFAHISSIAFNELLVRKSYATWKRGIQIQYNLSQLEDWVSRIRQAHPNWIPYGPPLPQTEHLLQAVKLLQLAKSATTEDIPVIQEACPALTTSQIRRILSLYTPDEFEDGPVCSALMRALALKCQQEELSGQSSELTIPEIHPDAEPLKLSIKPIAPGNQTNLPASLVPPSLWKIFTLTRQPQSL